MIIEMITTKGVDWTLVDGEWIHNPECNCGYCPQSRKGDIDAEAED